MTNANRYSVTIMQI